MPDPINLREYGEREMLDLIEFDADPWFEIGEGQEYVGGGFAVWRDGELGLRIAYLVVFGGYGAPSQKGIVEEHVLSVTELGNLDELDWFPLGDLAELHLGSGVAGRVAGSAGYMEAKDCWVDSVRDEVRRILGAEGKRV